MPKWLMIAPGMTQTSTTLLYLHPHQAANDPVTLHKGPATVNYVKGTAVADGVLVLRWLPSVGLRLEMDGLSHDAPQPGEQVQVNVAGSVADALVSSVQHIIRGGNASTRIRAAVRVFETGTGNGLASIGFQVLNFPDFFTPGQRALHLQFGHWDVTLEGVPDSQALFKSLNETGGFGFTHLGQLRRRDNSTFSASCAESVFESLTAFLSFARGASCNAPIRWGGSAERPVIWQKWGSPVVDSWKTPHNWFDEHHGGLLEQVIPAFVDAYEDPALGSPLKLALHWYQRSNMRAGGMEGAIILGLTALDLLGRSSSSIEKG